MIARQPLPLVDMGLSRFEISWNPGDAPTLEETAEWGLAVIEDRWSDEVELLATERTTVNGHEVIVRTYQHPAIKVQDAYIARENDMIALTLRTRPGSFEKYKPIFDEFVRSFEPKE